MSNPDVRSLAPKGGVQPWRLTDAILCPERLASHFSCDLKVLSCAERDKRHASLCR